MVREIGWSSAGNLGSVKPLYTNWRKKYAGMDSCHLK
jgi:hypothetical protein